MDKLKALRKNYILINSMFLYIILNLFLGEFQQLVSGVQTCLRSHIGLFG